MGSFQKALNELRLSVHEPAETEIAELEKERLKEQRQRELEGWKRRGVTKRYFEATWENWISDTPEKKSAFKNAKQAWDKNLLFTGKNGTGKTHLAMCLAKDGATYRRLPDIFREVRTDFEGEKEILEYYGERKLLIIDEIGRQKFSDFEINLFFEIIDRRWNNVLNTLIITNLSPQEFTEFYGTAIVDRLRPLVVRFDWESARG
jgi:DNA replication protein DnaC